MKTTPLAGRHVRLEPFDATLREPVRAALDCDPDAWRLFAINGRGAHFDGFWRALNDQVAQGGGSPTPSVPSRRAPSSAPPAS